GLDIGRPDGVVATAPALLSQFDTINRWTLLIGLAPVLVLGLGKRLAPQLALARVVLAASTLLSWVLSLADKGVAVLGAVPTGLPSPTMPNMSTSLLGDLAPVALTIAVIAYAEGVSVAKAPARRTREKIYANQELVSTGAANVAAGLF